MEQLRLEKQDIDQQLRAVQGTNNLGSMQNFPVHRRSERGGGGGGGGGYNDDIRSSNSRGTSRGRGRGGRGGNGRGGGGNSRYEGNVHLLFSIRKKNIKITVNVCFFFSCDR